MWQARLDKGDHTLMTVASRHRIKPLIVHRMNRDTGSLGALDQFACAAVAAAGRNVDRLDAIWMLAKPGDDSVKTDEVTSVAQCGCAMQ